MTKTKDIELYVTSVEQEAYDLGGQLALASVRSAVINRDDVRGQRFYVVVVKAPEARERAKAIRRKMFGA
jgi:hypothetical protein